MKKLIPAKTVGAAGVLDYTKELADRFTLADRFGEEYTMYHKDGDDIWLPRGLCTSDHAKYDMGVPVQFADKFVPRHDDQSRVVSEAAQLLYEGVDFILQAPTGYGKTYVGAALISAVKRRTLVITTKEDIIPQWMEAVRNCCGVKQKEIGVWRADCEPHPDHKIVIGLVHSILKGPDRYGKAAYMGFGLVIADEVHRMGADQFSQAMWWLPAYRRLGLSATPDRKDGRMGVIRGHIGPVRVKAKQDVMKFKVVAQASGWKVPTVNWYGTYKKMPHSPGKTMNLDKAMGSNKSRNQMITNFVRAAVKKGRNTIVFSSRTKHLQALQEMFVGSGISPSKIGFYVGLDGYKGSQIEKKQQRESAKACPVILATYSMASEATDIPWLDTAVFATPRSDVVQIVGRIRREWEGKPEPVVFDIVDSDSKVFTNYWKKRKKWYQSVGAKLVIKN